MAIGLLVCGYSKKFELKNYTFDEDLETNLFPICIKILIKTKFLPNVLIHHTLVFSVLIPYYLVKLSLKIGYVAI